MIRYTRNNEAQRITFHAVGDTGASDSRKYRNALRVADQLTADSQTTEANNRPSFFLHLGDVVYSFGESRYYYDQFYEPFGRIRLRSSQFRAITTASSFRAPARAGAV